MFEASGYTKFMHDLLQLRRELLDLYISMSAAGCYSAETLGLVDRRLDLVRTLIMTLSDLQGMGPIAATEEACGVEVTPVVTQ